MDAADDAAAQRVHDVVDAHLDDWIAELADWVRIPSIAGVAERRPALRRSASWLAAALRATGFPRVEVWDGDDGPAVHAEWPGAPGAPTVLVYSHHDVRAVKDENWDETAPFEPIVRDGRLYGRGASDAKGQVLAHLWGVRAHLEATGRTAPAVTLRLLVEGEEETGSAGLGRLLDTHRDRLVADVIVYSDSLLWREDHPAICTSVRGMVGAHLSVLGPRTDIHSGAVSGPAPNPAIELGRLLGRLHDEDGRIALPAFYDDVVPPSDERRAALAALPYSDDDWLARSRTRSIHGEAGWTVLERLWERPSLEVIALAAGDPVGVSRAAIPSLAEADLSIRIVEGQRVDAVAEQLRAWVAREIRDGYGWHLELELPTAQPAYRTPGTPVLAALERSMARGFRVDAVGRMGNAGGGPAHLLPDRLGAPVVFFGTGLVEDAWHDSDESVSIGMLRGGAATLALLWEELGG